MLAGSGDTASCDFTRRIDYGGGYTLADGRRIVVNPASGKGEVVAEIDGITHLAKCKGGIIDTRHSGQVSRLSKGLCTTVGLLMANRSPGPQIAIVPRTGGTLILARLAPHRVAAGIGIALVGARGGIVAG